MLTQPLCLILGRRVMLFLACVAVTSALPDAKNGDGEYGETSPAKLSEDVSEPSKSEADTEEFGKRKPINTSGNLYYSSGSVVWMGTPDDFGAVAVDGLLEQEPSLSSDSEEEEWNRRELNGKSPPRPSPPPYRRPRRCYRRPRRRRYASASFSNSCSAGTRVPT